MKRLMALAAALMLCAAPALAQTSELRESDKILLDYLAAGFTVVSTTGEGLLTVVLQKGPVLAICEMRPRGGATSYITNRCLESVGR